MRKVLFHPSVDALPLGPVSALKNSNPQIRLWALRALAIWLDISNIDNRKIIDDLAESILVSDSDPQVRAMALQVTQDGHRHLITNTKTHPLVRLEAIRRSDTEDYRTVKSLLKALRDDHYLIRTAALDKLSEVRQMAVYEKIVGSFELQEGHNIALGIIDLERIHAKLAAEPFIYTSRAIKNSDDESLGCKNILERAIHVLRKRAQNDGIASRLLNVKRER